MPEIIAKTIWMYLLAIAVSLAIAALIKLVVIALDALARKPAQAPAPVAAASAAEIDADHVTAIAAAVYAVVGAHRILHIEDVQRGRGWVVEGRLAHHASHTPDHHTRR